MAAARCPEPPSVFGNEQISEGHLLAKRDLHFPKAVPNLAQVRKVTVVVTVDRDGTICEAVAVAGPTRLRSAAVNIVMKHWRYRRFLVDWQPVVIQFPVSVLFVLPDRGPMRLTRLSPESRSQGGEVNSPLQSLDGGETSPLKKPAT